MVAEPVAAYVPMEPMSPAPALPRYWCDFCKEYMLMPHTLEYNYTLPSPTPVDPTQVAADSGMPDGVLNPWIFNTVFAPMLQQVAK